MKNLKVLGTILETILRILCVILKSIFKISVACWKWFTNPYFFNSSIQFLLIRGIIAGFFLYLICWQDWNLHELFKVQGWMLNTATGENTGCFMTLLNGIAAFVSIIVYIHLIFYAVAALNLIGSLTFGTGSFNSGGHEDRNQIDNMMQYRESKLRGMGNESASEELAKTQWLDGLNTGAYGGRTGEIKTFINSRLAGMGNERGYQWIKKSGSKFSK